MAELRNSAISQFLILHSFHIGHVMLDLAIVGGTVVTERGQFVGDVGIEGDRIALVAQAGGLPPARRVLNAEGLLVMPGFIDIHFHVRAPGHPERGTWQTETQAAAAGGITTLFEMPISVPCCARREVFLARKAQGSAQAYVNFALYGAPGLLERDEVLGMAEEGAIGYKIFTHGIQPGREDEFQGLCLEGEDELLRVMELTRETGLLTSFHAENQRLIDLYGERIKSTGRVDPMAFVESRPPVVEAMSVAQLRTLCAETGARVHIAHVSCAAALNELRHGQRDGLPMTGETCPHYLLFTYEDMAKHGPFALIKPPLRTDADHPALWQGLADGALMAITTDHSPFQLAEKERGLENIWQSAIGAPGVEALVPFVMTEALNGRFPLEKAVNLLSSEPARLFGLSPRKGDLQPGADADLTLYDPRGEGVIDSSRWFTKAKSIDRLYNGRPQRGHVAATVVNGRVVYEGGQIVGEEGWGRFVRPGAA
jgi:allantoinase